MIYALASWPHYYDHLAPIIDALPRSMFGGTYTPKNARRSDLPDEGLWLVAGHSDLVRLPGRQVVYVEHGAGQSYLTPSASYSGGPGNDAVLYVCPSETVAARWRAAYPGARCAVVGCPKLDRWHRDRGRETGTRPVVAFTFHHDGQVCPETNSAWPHYRKGLGTVLTELRGAGVDVIAHQHPRSRYTARRWFEGVGVPFFDDLGEVFDRADLLAADNTSALPEFASLGRPVVWLNAPWYRRDVHHGGRFWSWPDGQVQVDHPGELTGAILYALTDPPQVADARARMVHSVYAHTDGEAATRAAAAIMEVYADARP